MTSPAIAYAFFLEPPPMVAVPDDIRAASSVTILGGPLVSLLGTHYGGLSACKPGEQRMYVSALETVTKMNNRTSVTSHSIAHKVEARKVETAELFGAGPGRGGLALEMGFRLNKTLAEDAQKRIDTRRGNTALSANFVQNDHSKVVAYLASAVARFSQTGVMTWAAFTNDQEHVFNRDKIDGRVEEGSNVIYIPRVSSDDGGSNAWYAAVGAAMACGNRVVTDSTATDVENRVSLAPPTGRQLISGCIEALTRMGNYYAASNATVLFSLALARGVHEELTVVAHTDEGGYMRSMWRRNRFAMSYGVIWLHGERLGSLPMPVVVGISNVAGWIGLLCTQPRVVL
jgi:hypothetical protein